MISGEAGYTAANAFPVAERIFVVTARLRSRLRDGSLISRLTVPCAPARGLRRIQPARQET
jgi:hypothetical protein